MDRPVTTTPGPPKATPGQALIALAVLTPLIAVFVVGAGLAGLGGEMFASFVFLTYWGAIKLTDLKEWPAALAGSLAGVLIAWLNHALPGAFGTPGLALGLLVNLAMIYLLIVQGIPLVINNATILFVSILALPVLQASGNFVRIAAAIVVAAIYGGALSALSTRLMARKPA